MTEIVSNILKWESQLFLPPIGLFVYEMYGRSESEQTLIGGDTGRLDGLVSANRLLLRLSLVGAAIV